MNSVSSMARVGMDGRQSNSEGLQQTEIGRLPAEWQTVRLGELLSFQNGINADKHAYGSGIPFANVLEVITNTHLAHTMLPGRIKLTKRQEEAYAVKRGDILFNRTSETQEEIGLASVYEGEEPIVFGGFVIRGRPVSDRLHRHYAGWGLRAPVVREQIIARGQGAIRANVGQADLRTVIVPLPPLAEQKVIAEALSDADALIDSLKTLIIKKRAINKGAMQELLTGNRRLPGFRAKWQEVMLGRIASPVLEKNSAGLPLPVLTCSKHLGFVDSLSYFKNQVFSRDTSGYRVIRRGQIGYPANHIEEGSIGLQDLYDAALVSPIYVVFSVSDGVSSYFVHRLLKLEEFRQKFEMATSASVDRRGSLRWPTFSQIHVVLPGYDEQAAIASVLSDMETEIAVLNGKLTKARAIREGMMRELLTGRVRLV